MKRLFPAARILSIALATFAPARAFAIFGSPTPDTTLPVAALVGFKNDQGDAEALEDLSDRLFREAYRARKWRLVERERADAILREQALQQAAPCSTSCTSSLGQILGAKTLLIPSLDRCDGISHLALREVDAATGEVLRMAEAETGDPLSESGRKLATLAVRRLVGDPFAPATDSGAISITTWPPSRVWIDGEEAGTSPLTISVWPGLHRVSVAPDMGAPASERASENPPDFQVGALIDLRAGSDDFRHHREHRPEARRDHHRSDLQRHANPPRDGDRAHASQERQANHGSNDKKDDDDGAAAAVVAGVVVAAVGVGLLAAAASAPDSLWDRTSMDVRVKAGDTAKVSFQKSPNGNKTALGVIGVIGLMLAITLIAIGVSHK